MISVLTGESLFRLYSALNMSYTLEGYASRVVSRKQNAEMFSQKVDVMTSFSKYWLLQAVDK